MLAHARAPQVIKLLISQVANHYINVSYASKVRDGLTLSAFQPLAANKCVIWSEFIAFSSYYPRPPFVLFIDGIAGYYALGMPIDLSLVTGYLEFPALK